MVEILVPHLFPIPQLPIILIIMMSQNLTDGLTDELQDLHELLSATKNISNENKNTSRAKMVARSTRLSN